MIRQYELVEKVRAYDPHADEALLNRAYVFSMKAHGTQKRASGDPYFSHPLEVAGILTDMKLDCATVVTGLLHDTIEDTIATDEEIKELFGPEISQLVDGVTKLSRIEMTSESRDSREKEQAENFRKFLLAMSNDIRVLLVKLADRLHNMRTLHFIAKPEKRRRIALETMEIYAPLAERIGMHRMKDELEDLAFKELHPDIRDSLIARLDFLRKEAGDLREKVQNALQRTLLNHGIEAVVFGREKRPFSIWRKMERNHLSFEQLYDVIAFRMIVKDVETCYRALGIVHGAWPMVPGRFKDYISTPKANGYQSIHTAVIGPEKQRIEIQIRTQEMHAIAEFGVAAHWQYKQSSEYLEGKQYRWLRELLEILESANSPEEFLEHTKLEMFQDQVFCFTPKGDLIALPRGATAVDFAYAVHTNVGNTCVGARVNGRVVPLRAKLANGDQVEILRSTAQTPNAAWESFVVTGKARAAIKRFLRARQREEFLGLGRTLVETAFRQEGYDLTDRALEPALAKLKQRAPGDLYAELGQGLLTVPQVMEAIFPGIALKGTYGRPRAKKASGSADGAPIPIKGLTRGVSLHLGECCHPVPGDRIVGISMPHKGVEVHTIDCTELEAYTNSPDRWLDIAWAGGDELNDVFVGRIKLEAMNEPDALARVSSVIADNEGNISALKMTVRESEWLEMTIDVEVRNLKHLTNIIAALRAVRIVNKVERARE